MPAPRFGRNARVSTPDNNMEAGNHLCFLGYYP